jgi:hypothetical protein
MEFSVRPLLFRKVWLPEQNAPREWKEIPHLEAIWLI